MQEKKKTDGSGELVQNLGTKVLLKGRAIQTQDLTATYGSRSAQTVVLSLAFPAGGPYLTDIDLSDTVTLTITPGESQSH